MATYKELFFKAIDQLVDTVKTKDDEIEVKNKIKSEIKLEEIRISYSNIKERNDVKDKFRKFYEKFDNASLLTIVNLAKDIIETITKDI